MGNVSGIYDCASRDNIRRIEGLNDLAQHIRIVHAHAGHHRVTARSPKLVLRQRLFGKLQSVIEVIRSIECGIADEIKSGSVKGVGARARDCVDRRLK